MSFKLVSLKIHDNCSPDLAKNLSPGRTYSFINTEEGKELPQDFFAKNINIHCIVGANGAGKSSLLDIIYRMVNNFSCQHLAALFSRAASQELHMIDRLYATLDYCFIDEDGIETKYELVCEGLCCRLMCNGDDLTQALTKEKETYGVTNNDSFKNLPPKKKTELEGMAIELMNHFFYSIVANYSIQAFNGNDYHDEKLLNWDGTEDAGNHIWIDSLFNKNDGYLVPIVLTPYRAGGKFDLNNETYITRSNLAALLVYSKEHGNEFVPGYELEDIEYKYNCNYVQEKFDEQGKGQAAADFLHNKLQNRMPDSYADRILNAYKGIFGVRLDVDDAIYLDGLCYLIYKTLSIASSYPSYERFSKLASHEDVFNFVPDKNDTLSTQLVREIKTDHSHITLKIRQTVNFLNHWTENITTWSEKFTFFWPYKKLIIEEYLKYKDNLDVLKKLLPPPFFDANIKLRHKHGVESIEGQNPEIERPLDQGESISFYKLSSGERQLMYMLSNVFSHIYNLRSVFTTNDRIRYDHINIILDEIELSFHPEYQRRIVKMLIDTICLQGLNETMHFNILIVTHSPFVLSDIPKQNILALEAGQPKNAGLDSFGANIYDMLRNSFFLEKGGMGDFAREKINSIVEKLEDEESNPQELKRTIELIDEPIIKKSLLRTLYKNFPELASREEKERMIKDYRQKIADLEKDLN